MDKITNPKDKCKCIKVIGHLEEVRWMIWERKYQASAGPLALGDWCRNPYIWMYHVESHDGSIRGDDVLMNTHTRYWSIHDVQRYFIGDLHCEKVLFTCQYPNLRMPTALGSYLWKANTALKLPSRFYLKELHRSLEVTLKKMVARDAQMDRLIISDQLLNVDLLDHYRRKTFFKNLNDIISSQDRLQLVSLENLGCKRLEGVRLLQTLATFNADTLKYLFLWRFLLSNENPILINYSYITGSGQYIPRPDTRYTFLRSLAELRNLVILALEYSHIADGTGAALITLLPVLKRPHFKLQLICRENQTPDKNDTSLGCGGYGIPDTAWRRTLIACPDLYLSMTFFRIRDYDSLRRFLTPSIPLRESHWQMGIDLKQTQRQDSDMSCFVRHISHFYGHSLGTLSIYQWRFTVYPLWRILEFLPHLVRFIYVGRVADEVDLLRMLQIIACGVCCKLKQILIKIQDEENKRDYWQRVVHKLNEDYSDVMQLYDVKFCFEIYKV